MTHDNKPESDEVYPLDLAEVLAEEVKETKGAVIPSDNLETVFNEIHGHELTALCFSGGGIRSATFGLGIVQALAKHGLLSKFDYLSTASGGGYLGSWLSAWVCREHRKRDDLADRDFGIRQVQENINCREIRDREVPNPEPSELQHLREYSNYMSPRTGLLSADTWTLAAIYLRNLFLNLTIFVPLLTAVLLLPRFLFRIAVVTNVDAQTELWALIIGAVAGSFAIAFVISRLPSKTRDEIMPAPQTKWERFKAFLNTDPGVLIFGVLPLLLSAFLASVLWVWTYVFVTKPALHEYYPVFQFQFWGLIDPTLGYFLLVSGAAYLLGVVIFLIIKFRKAERDLTAAIAAFVSTLIGAVILWVVAYKIFPYALECVIRALGDDRGGRFIWQIYLSTSVPLFLIIVLLTASLFVGMTSRTATDEDREWLARYGAWVLIVAGVWTTLNVLVLLGPSLLQWLFRFDVSQIFSASAIPAVVSSVAAAISGIISLLGGFSGKGLVRDEPVKTRASTFLAYAPKIASVIFLIFILIGLAFLGTWIFYKMELSSEINHVAALQQVTNKNLFLVFVGLAFIGTVMACFVNVNKFSLHGAYRDRLVRAYLGASNAGRKQNTFIGFDDNDNLELHELSNQRPLHIVNATVNLVGGKNLAWQNRKAASFTMSALHCGSWAVRGYRASREYCRSTTTGKALRLGTAMAISGAAANPNMGYYSSSVVTFLMSFFNIRLGWWLGNTGEPGSRYHWFGLGRRRFFEKVGPSIAILPLLNETLGRTDEKKKFLMVTDGGHFENLAVYEMVLRRCKLIVLSDGAADELFKFGEIANAIQKCKVDLGVDIKLLGAMNIYARGAKVDDAVRKSRFALAQITYPEKYLDTKTGGEKNHTGLLLYMRPTYYGTTEPRDVQYYAESNLHFPHQSTGDQMYDEKQFEAYRSLGFLTMSEIIGDSDPETLEDLFAELQKTLAE